MMAAAARLDPLERLSHAVDNLMAFAPLTGFGGAIVEVAPSYCRVAGLSQLVKLGECVEIADHGRTSIM